MCHLYIPSNDGIILGGCIHIPGRATKVINSNSEKLDVNSNKGALANNACLCPYKQILEVHVCWTCSLVCPKAQWWVDTCWHGKSMHMMLHTGFGPVDTSSGLRVKVGDRPAGLAPGHTRARPGTQWYQASHVRQDTVKHHRTKRVTIYHCSLHGKHECEFDPVRVHNEPIEKSCMRP